jgi:hypothetical protein
MTPAQRTAAIKITNTSGFYTTYMDTTVIDALLASNVEGSSAFTKRDAHNQRMIQITTGC